MSETILVTGATGQLGQRVVHHLLETQGVAPESLILLSRDPGKLSDLSARGVQARIGDFDDAASLGQAFDGADRILIISTDAVGEPGKRLRQHLAAVSAAATAGAHIAYTSMLAPEPGNPVLLAPDHYGTEQAIKETGRPYTIFRNGWYQENLLMTLPQAIKMGTLYTSAGEGRTSHIAREDVARAIAASLASGSTESITYQLTGPEALTATDVAALAGEVAGKQIPVVNLTDEQLLEGIKAAGVPEGFARLLVSFDANARTGSNSLVTDDVATLSGQQPLPLRAFLESSKAALIA